MRQKKEGTMVPSINYSSITDANVRQYLQITKYFFATFWTPITY